MAMSAEHKAALAQGRKEARAIKAYLDALASRRPGRPVTKTSLEARIARLDERIAEELNALKAVELRQQRLDAERSLADIGEQADIAVLEKEFVGAVAGYSERKGISYNAWRESGVPAGVLKEAGIPRTRRT